MAPVDWDKIRPQNDGSNLDLDNAEEVPAEVLARFQTTRGLGRTVKRETEGRMVVRTIDGTVFLVPVLS